MVIHSVARATDGAAPKSPAKLFGFKTSLIAAKLQTIIPPITKRRRRCVSNEVFELYKAPARRQGSWGIRCQLIFPPVSIFVQLAWTPVFVGVVPQVCVLVTTRTTTIATVAATAAPTPTATPPATPSPPPAAPAPDVAVVFTASVMFSGVA